MAGSPDYLLAHSLDSGPAVLRMSLASVPCAPTSWRSPGQSV